MSLTFLLITDLFIFLGGAAVGAWVVWAYYILDEEDDE